MPNEKSRKSRKRVAKKGEGARAATAGSNRGHPSQGAAPPSASARSSQREKPKPHPRVERSKSKASLAEPRLRRSKAREDMTLTELQFMAKSAGIPFGGVAKSNLVRKINMYRHDGKK